MKNIIKNSPQLILTIQTSHKKMEGLKHSFEGYDPTGVGLVNGRTNIPLPYC